MVNFGNYKTTVELCSRSGIRTLAAERVGDSVSSEDHAAVVKVLRTADDDGVEPENPQAFVVEFLDGAKLQQRIASESAFWVKVFETGLVPGGAFVASERYPNSVQRLLDKQARMSGGQLLALAAQVIRGLDDLRRVADRAHGNLKPSNILLRDGGPDAPRRAALADPVPTAAASSSHSAADLEALGRVLYQLALRMQVAGPLMHPVADAPEWEQLGKQGPRVRELCDLLLDPDLDPRIKWTQLRKKFASRERQRKLTRRTMAMAIVAGLVATGGYYLVKHPPSVQALAFWNRPANSRASEATSQRTAAETGRGVGSDLAATQDRPRDPPPASAGTILAGLIDAANPAAPFKLTIDAQVYRSQLGSGPCVGLTISADADCYLLLICRDSTGKINLLLPNGLVDRCPRIGRGQRVTVQSFGFELPVEAPYGRTTFKVIATTRRVRLDGAQSNGATSFLEGLHALSVEDRSGTAAAIDKLLYSEEWNAAEVDLVTRAPG